MKFVFSLTNYPQEIRINISKFCFQIIQKLKKKKKNQCASKSIDISWKTMGDYVETYSGSGVITDRHYLTHYTMRLSLSISMHIYYSDPEIKI